MHALHLSLERLEIICVYTYAYVYVNECVCIYIYVYWATKQYTYIYIYIYTHTHTHIDIENIVVTVSHSSRVWLFMTPMTYSPQDFSVHGISQARILEWTTISLSSGSSKSRDWTHVSCTGRRILYHCITWEAHTETHIYMNIYIYIYIYICVCVYTYIHFNALQTNAQ